MRTKFKRKKALLKRIKVTGTAKWIRHSAHTSHLAAGKSKQQKHRLDKQAVVKLVDQKRLKKLI